MHHSTWCGVVLMVVWIVLAGAPSAGAQDPDVLRIGHAEPDTLDPHLAVSGKSQGMMRFLYRGLLRFAIRDGRVSTSEVEPDLAESWVEPDADHLTWVFQLRQGIQFHKGFGEMTAEDVKFSFERQMRDTQHMPYANNLDVIRSINVVNKHVVRIALKYPDPVFPLRIVGYQQGYIVSKQAVQQYGEQFQWNPVGTGPFYFEQLMKDEKIILKAHHAYLDPREAGKGLTSMRPSMSEVHWFDVRDDAMKLLGLQYGAFDIIYPSIINKTLVARAKQIGAVLDKRGPGMQWNLFFNTTKKPFDDLEARLAVMSAIDRQAIGAAVWGDDLSMLATSPLPPGYVGHTPVEIPAYDPKRTQAFLSKSGRTELSLHADYVSEALPQAQIMALVQAQLAAVGIKLPLLTVAHATYHERIRDNLNAMVLYGATRITHADVMLGLFYHSSQAPDPRSGNHGTNFAHYRGIDHFLEAARQSRHDSDRLAFYHQAQERLMRDAVVLPIAVVPDMSVRNPKRVRSPFDPELGEFALHYFYNYPERFELIK